MNLDTLKDAEKVP